MTIEMFKSNILTIVNDYPIKRITLFGSRVTGKDNENSDVDLIMEFSLPISLLTLSMIKLKLEEILEVGVDIVHGPIEKSDLIEIGKVVELYAA